jgi:hypothetical protein
MPCALFILTPVSGLAQARAMVERAAIKAPLELQSSPPCAGSSRDRVIPYARKTAVFMD